MVTAFAAVTYTIVRRTDDFGYLLPLFYRSTVGGLYGLPFSARRSPPPLRAGGTLARFRYSRYPRTYPAILRYVG